MLNEHGVVLYAIRYLYTVTFLTFHSWRRQMLRNIAAVIHRVGSGLLH